MPRMATSGASRETKPNTPMVKLISDDLAISGQGDIVGSVALHMP